MPSIRKRLKKLTSSKKSKSTSDLDQLEQPERRSMDDEDTRSHISEAISERTDMSLNESTYSYASNSADGKKKKKRKLKLSLSKKKKKEDLVKDPSGNVIFRSLSVEHDPRGIRASKENIDDASLKPESVELSKSVGSNIGRDDSSGADDWRMSGLLENVERTSNASLNDNLISTFEERRRTLAGKPGAESTPIQDKTTAQTVAPSKGIEIENEEEKITTYTKATHIIEVSFTNKGDSDDKKEAKAETEEKYLPGDDVEDDGDDLVDFRRELEPVEEEDFTELRSVDPECEIDFDGKVIEDGTIKGEAITRSDGVLKEVESKREERPVEVIDDHSVVCDTGRGKRVIIRHLEEVVSNANMELSEKVNMEDWLVLNIEKDDWVVVGYSKVGGEVAQLFEQSVDTI